MLNEGVCAEIKVRSEHLRLFSEQNAQGVQASVDNVNPKKWITPSESVERVEQGKLKAATYAEAYRKQVANLELPILKWKAPEVNCQYKKINPILRIGHYVVAA